MPRVERSLPQLQQYADALRTRTNRYRGPAEQAAATRLLAQQGFDASRWVFRCVGVGCCCCTTNRQLSGVYQARGLHAAVPVTSRPWWYSNKRDRRCAKYCIISGVRCVRAHNNSVGCSCRCLTLVPNGTESFVTCTHRLTA